MERKIGEIFEYNGEWYQCLESSSCRCDYCDFDGLGDCDIIACASGERKDSKEVHFKKLEKVGEAYDDCGTILQRFRIHTNVTNADTKGLELHIYSNNTIGIEIKQTKEDMEEYRMHDAQEDIPEFDKIVDKCLFGEDKLNLKPFDLEAAKAGKPVCTRDGHKARIICFDLKNDEYPIVAAVENDSSETLFSYTTNGEIADGIESDKDLMMLLEKKEGWVNVYKDSVYDTKDEALIGRSESRGYIDTIKINWSE